MKKFLLKILVLLGIYFCTVPKVLGELTLEIPTAGIQEDVNIQGSTSIDTDSTEFIDIIKIINKYLWFSLGLIAMIIFVYAGILLIVGGKKDNFDKANKMLLSAGVAIVVSMLSYTIINLLINLF